MNRVKGPDGKFVSVVGLFAEIKSLGFEVLAVKNRLAQAIKANKLGEEIYRAKIEELQGRIDRSSIVLEDHRLNKEKAREETREKDAKIAELEAAIKQAAVFMKPMEDDLPRYRTALFKVYDSRLFGFLHPKLLREVENALFPSPIPAPLAKVDSKPETKRRNSSSEASEIKR